MIYIGIACILAAITAALMNPYMRFRLKEIHTDNTLTPPVSIILLADRNATKLDNHLDVILAQQYAQSFEVIVVTEKGHSEVQDVLQRRADDKRIYSTFVPQSSRYMSRTKLAITLGVKAANFEWLVLLDANTKPMSDLWLQSMAAYMTDNRNIVLGYANYANKGSKTYHRYESLFVTLYHLRKAQKGYAYRTNMTNFAFRKSDFIAGDGYRGNLEYARGEIDFLVNKFAKRDASAIAVNQEAWAEVAGPFKKQWKEEHLSTLYLRRKLKRWFPIFLLAAIDQLVMHLCLWLCIAVLLFGIFNHNPILIATATLSLVTYGATRLWWAHRAISHFKADIPIWKVPVMELSYLWRWTTYYQLRLFFSSKIEFTSHRL